MCRECRKEFRGWCKSFTQTEILLGILEAILLVICIAFLVFLVVHMVVCANGVIVDKVITTEAPLEIYTSGQTRECTTGSTPKPEAKCSWEPSKKTVATTHHFLDETAEVTTQMMTTQHRNLSDLLELGGKLDLTGVDSLVLDDQSDGEEPDNDYKTSVLALVKSRPPRDLSFGCILTVVSKYWTVTAASCIEAIEVVDSLDNFVMMEEYGSARARRERPLADVQLHPQYRGGAGAGEGQGAGADLRYDVAALRSERALAGAGGASGGAGAPRLPSLLDYFSMTVGERLTILGFGGFRSIDPGGVRSVEVYSVARAQCAGGAGAGAGAGAGRRGAGALCAGVRFARGAPCYYCAGTPLLRARLLLGVMTSSRACAVACEPALYVNLALVRDWLDMVLNLD